MESRIHLLPCSWFTAFCAHDREYLSIAGRLTTVNFFQKDDSRFSLLRSALAKRMKELIMISLRIGRPTYCLLWLTDMFSSLIVMFTNNSHLDKPVAPGRYTARSIDR